MFDPTRFKTHNPLKGYNHRRAKALQQVAQQGPLAQKELEAFQARLGPEAYTVTTILDDGRSETRYGYVKDEWPHEKVRVEEGTYVQEWERPHRLPR